MKSQLSDDEVQSLVDKAVDLLAGPRTPEQEALYQQIEAESQSRRRLAEDFLRTPSAPLELRKLRDGILSSHKNAQELLFDAELLSQHHRAARCYALSHTTIEEVGKMAVIHEMTAIPRTNQRLWADIWKKFRDHKTKYALGRVTIWNDRLYEQMGASSCLGDTRLEDSVPERIRQNGLYVEFLLSDDRWGEPKEINQKMAHDELRLAHESVRQARYYVDRDLYSLDNLSLRQSICGRVYPTSGDLPKDKFARVESVLNLLKARQTFFAELVNKQVLLPRFPPDLRP